jgi:uncharacterized membrane protein YeaQ/YmgE (transglycosylase-associated protein family)
MDLIFTLVIGGMAGWLGSIVTRTNAQMGVLANVVVAIVGSFIGRAIANQMALGPGGAIASWVISIVGAMLLISLLKALSVFGRVATCSLRSHAQRAGAMASAARRTPASIPRNTTA